MIIKGCMLSVKVTPPKPTAEQIRPELTQLPVDSWSRRLFRRLLRLVARMVLGVCTRIELSGLENIPKHGPALFVANHLGDTDAVVAMAYFPRFVESLAKVELYDLPVIGLIGSLYGVIWVHRGQPDRRALRAALDGLRAGRCVAIAPEGRESTTGKLEEGMGGAAYLALKAQVPVVPFAFTGTENWRVYGNLKKLHRTAITMTVGPPFMLPLSGSLRESIDQGTETIMSSVAELLPAGYRGYYAETVEVEDDQR